MSYHENVLSEEEKNNLLEWLDSVWNSKCQNIHVGSRKVVQFGYEYIYSKRDVGKLGEDIPEILKTILISKIQDSRAQNINQCIINRYLDGEVITEHIDAHVFESPICCFTFGSEAEMLFLKRDKQRNILDKYSITPKSNSLYIMDGEARSKWSHQMIAHKNDTPRYSFTFRIVN